MTGLSCVTWTFQLLNERQSTVPVITLGKEGKGRPDSFSHMIRETSPKMTHKASGGLLAQLQWTGAEQLIATTIMSCEQMLLEHWPRGRKEDFIVIYRYKNGQIANFVRQSYFSALQTDSYECFADSIPQMALTGAVPLLKAVKYNVLCNYRYGFSIISQQKGVTQARCSVQPMHSQRPSAP